jgi:hypothetical protein
MRKPTACGWKEQIKPSWSAGAVRDTAGLTCPAACISRAGVMAGVGVIACMRQRVAVELEACSESAHDPPHDDMFHHVVA